MHRNAENAGEIECVNMVKVSTFASNLVFMVFNSFLNIY